MTLLDGVPINWLARLEGCDEKIIFSEFNRNLSFVRGNSSKLGTKNWGGSGERKEGEEGEEAGVKSGIGGRER